MQSFVSNWNGSSRDLDVPDRVTVSLDDVCVIPFSGMLKPWQRHLETMNLKMTLLTESSANVIREFMIDGLTGKVVWRNMHIWEFRCGKKQTVLHSSTVSDSVLTI